MCCLCRQAGRLGGARRDRTDDLKLAKLALSQLSYCPIRLRPEEGLWRDEPALSKVRWRDSQAGLPSRSSRSERRLVGLGRFELPTSRLSSARSNQLSYRPANERNEYAKQRAFTRRKRNEDGGNPAFSIGSRVIPIGFWPRMSK